MPITQLKNEALERFNAKDYKQALELYLYLANQGVGCEANQEKAIEWCRKSAFNGHQKAKDIMHRMQQDGQIVF